jgi:flagellar biosynthetic protein FliR
VSETISQLLSEHLAVTALVLVRIAALVLVAPVLGPFELALRWRAALAMALVMLIAPLEITRIAAPPATLAQFLILAGGEALVGLMLGLGVRILFTSMQVAGQLISQMSGLQLAEVFSPGLGANVPVFSQLLLLVSTAVFFVIGGHRQMIEALLDSFTRVPAGQAAFSSSAVEAVTALVTQSFVLGLRAAAPAVVALLLATLIVGFVSRTLPQLNIMALGFGINAVVALVAIGASLGGACWVFQDTLQPVLQSTLASFSAPH